MTTPRAELPRLTNSQEAAKNWQRTVDQFSRMGPTQIDRFISGWLDAFGEEIRKAACEKCIPPWLLASVLLAEVLGMNEYYGSTERELEASGMGSSVGLGQITVDTAIKYGLTPGSKNFKQKADRIQRDLEPLLEGEEYEVGVSVMRTLIRRELLNPLNNIRASACYLKNLIEQAIAEGKLSGYAEDGSSPWGELDFGQLNQDDCPINLIDITGARGTKCSRIEKIVGFFAAAHNDDAVSNFSEGIGLTQGRNAQTIGLFLCIDKYIEKYNLEHCEKIVRKPSENPEAHWNEYEWDELTNEEQRLWRQLGWNREKWSSEIEAEYPESFSTRWSELTPGQRATAETLGYDESAWNEGF